CAAAISCGEAWRADLFALLTGKGNEGWDRTGARVGESSIMASAKLPVKHMPIAPTPGPPWRSCASLASARSQSMIGLDWFAPSTRNSLLMQARATELNM